MNLNYRPQENTERSSISWIHVFSVGYMVVLIISVTVLESFIVIPFLFPSSPGFYLHLAVYLYCMVNVMVYYYKVVTCDVSCEQMTTSPTRKLSHDEGARTACFFCHECQRNSPARAHHCNLCGKCIDRRDHHCYFIANCIGQANLRYFIVLNLFSWLVSTYSVSINILYLHHTAIPLSPLTVDGITTFIPVVTFYKWCVGSIQLFYFMVVMVTWFTLVQVLISLACGGFQMRLLCTGQTTYEYSHGIHTYNHGWRQNFEDICGKHWLVNWILPVPSSKQFICSDRSEDTYTVWQEDQPRKVV